MGAAECRRSTGDEEMVPGSSCEMEKNSKPSRDHSKVRSFHFIQGSFSILGCELKNANTKIYGNFCVNSLLRWFGMLILVTPCILLPLHLQRWLQDRLTTASAKHSDLIAEVKLNSKREFEESSGSRLLWRLLETQGTVFMCLTLCSKRMPFRLYPAGQQVHERITVFVNGLQRQTDFLTIDSALHERHAAAKTAFI